MADLTETSMFYIILLLFGYILDDLIRDIDKTAAMCIIVVGTTDEGCVFRGNPRCVYKQTKKVAEGKGILK